GELLELYLPIPDLGEEQILVAQEAQRLAFEVLEMCAWSYYADETPEEHQLDELLEPLLPPEAERAPKLEGTVRKLLQRAKILRHDNKEIHFRHYAWREYFAARAFKKHEAEIITPLLLEHLYDSDWSFLLECYVGLGKADALVKPLLKEAMTEGNLNALRRVARWATVAPEGAPWRKYVLQALAQVFVHGDLDLEERLDVGQALALVAGEGARPLYLQTLRNPNIDVRAASLRGLGWTGRPREMKILAAGLNVSQPEIQKQAVLALADLGTSGAFRFLTDALIRSDEALTMIIAETLAKYPEGWEALKEATQVEDLVIRRAAARGLGRVHQPWAREILRTLALEDPQWLVRSAAEAALMAQEGSDEDAVIAPPPRPDSAQWLINWAARQGLGLGVGEAALQMLIRAVEVGDAQVRILAVETLGQMGHREHLEALRPLLEDDDPRVREAAREAYE
ncbi:MAG: HEAT repeat domain-containing protein, partial [Anaerolineae bacterium]